MVFLRSSSGNKLGPSLHSAEKNLLANGPDVFWSEMSITSCYRELLYAKLLAISTL